MPVPIHFAEKIASPSRRRSVWTGLMAFAIIALIAPRIADALEPGRSLTQYLHRIWQTQQGLPQPTVYSISQTSDGYLWLGTQTGLVRFDGVRFTALRDVGDISLDKLWIRDLLADQDRGLWMAADHGGLLYLRDGAIKRLTVGDGLPSDNVHCLLFDRAGTLWIGTDKGLASFTTASGKIARYGSANEPADQDVEALCQADDGTIWIGGNSPQVIAWNGSAFSSHPLKSVSASTVVRDLLATHNGTLWVGTNNGLLHLHNGVERRFTAQDGLADDSVICLADGGNGSVLAGTKNGFSRLVNDDIESFATRDGLSQSTVYTLFFDREGSLWVGTKHGLNQFLDRRTIPFTANEGLPSNDTGPVYQDQAGNIWVGTLGAGLSRFDGHHFSLVGTAQGLAGKTIMALAADEDDGLWVGTDRGLNRLRGCKVEQTYTTAQGLPSPSILCLFRDNQKDLWAGTDAGIARLENGRFVQPTGAGGQFRGAVLAIAQQKDGSLIFSTSGGGLYTCVNNQLSLLEPANGVAPDVDAFFLDPDGLLWMGTRGGGLRVLDGGKSFTYSVKDGLYDDDIFGIVADNQNNLWLACSKGIFSVNRSDLKDFAAGKIKTLMSNPFSPTDALRTIECKAGVQPAAFRMRDGKVWFSTIHGVLVIDTEHLNRKLLPVPVVVEDVIVNGNAMDPEHVTGLPHGQANVEFRYTALSFIAPTRITFRYMLEGFDKNWIEADSRREAFYTNLPPGGYRFRVMAQNVDATWSECANPVVFTLSPYFYQTRWFFPLCVLILGSLVWLAYRQRVSRIREQLHAVVTERSRIARELHDTLMQGFSGITMEMQALSAKLPASPEKDELHDIIGDAGTCLREARQSIAGLRTAPDKTSGLAPSIEQAARQMTEAKDVRLKLKLEPGPYKLPANVEYNLLRIAQESITNSVKHSGARTIEVALKSTPRELMLSVKDDGSGMNGRNGDRAQPGHYGLIGMKERAAQIGAELTIDSTLGNGTTISVLLPASPSKSNSERDV